ncbi:MAG: amidohydrolase [Flavobacteriales bacterium]|nr:amidohydrolase [Flavobacteriales bacterium]
MNPLRVTICQQPLVWENRQRNLEHFGNLLSSLNGQTDLVILPETFTTGFTTNTSGLAEPLHGETLEWMRRMAHELNASITGSFLCSEPGIESVQYFNRLLWMNADGSYFHYDKRHLFTFAGEHFHFSQGRERIIVTLKGWRICPLICYDLRFPVWSRNTATDPYDLLIYVANWPEARSTAWKDLLVARAHENQCYVVGVNRVGTDGKQIPYSGDSRAIGPRGEMLATFGPHQQGLMTVSLDRPELLDFRDRFRAWEDADRFDLRV